jgi:hypothetical protein
MWRERVLKVVLVLVGLLFTAGIYPIVDSLWHATQASEGPMMLSLYVTLGIFLLLAVRNPSAYRSLIAYAGWANIAHAAVMAMQSVRDVSERAHLLGGVALFGIIGVALIALAPAKPSVERVSAAAS